MTEFANRTETLAHMERLEALYGPGIMLSWTTNEGSNPGKHINILVMDALVAEGLVSVRPMELSMWASPQYSLNPVMGCEPAPRTAAIQNLSAAVEVYEAPATNPRLPLATPVRLSNRVEAVICDYAANDAQRYRVTWFNRRFWRVDYRWVNREQFEVIMEDEAERAR